MDNEAVKDGLKLEADIDDRLIIESLWTHVQTHSIEIQQTLDLLGLAYSMASIPILHEAVLLFTPQLQTLGAIRCYYTCLRIKDLVLSCKN